MAARMVSPSAEAALADGNALAQRAYETVAFYKKRGSFPGSLSALPLLSKRDIATTLPKAWFEDGKDARSLLAAGEVALVETAGTSGERARVLWDKGWWEARELAALREHPTARAAVDAPAYQEAVLAAPTRGMGSCHSGDPTYEERLEGHRLHLNSRQDPTYWTPVVMARMLDELERQKTVGLVADPMYLATLARFAAEGNRTLAVSGFCALTHSLATPAQRAAIRAVYKGPLFELYATRETGPLFVEREDGVHRAVAGAAVIELVPLSVPTPGAERVVAIVATPTSRPTMPLLRYVVGDLAQAHPTESGALASHEGRAEDVIVRPDGAWVTAGALGRALAPLGPAVSVQATQRDAASVEIDVVGAPAAAVRDAVAHLYEGLALAVRDATALAVEPSGRFRPSRRNFPVDLRAALEERR